MLDQRPKLAGFDDLVFRYKRFVFRFIVTHCNEEMGLIDRVVRHLLLRRPDLLSLVLRILRLKEFVDPKKPWHRPLSLASDQLIKRWPRETVFVSLRISAPDHELTIRDVTHWKEVTTTISEGLAGAYFELGRFHRAREALECAAVLKFRSSHFAYMLGSLYLLDGEETAAVPWFIEAAEISPGLSAPSEYFSITGNNPEYERTKFDSNNDDAWLRNAYNFVGQRALHVGEGQLRSAYHAKSIQKQMILRDRACPTPILADFFKQTKIDFDTMHVLPWEWASQIGHLGMLEIMLRMRSLGWWNGHAILLTHAPKVPNRAMLSLFKKFPDFTVVDDSYAGNKFVNPLAQELAGLLPSHGLPYYAWRYPDERVVPWHEAGAHTIWEWEAQDRGYPFREAYDSSCGKDPSTVEQAEKAFESWGMSASDWYVRSCPRAELRSR